MPPPMAFCRTVVLLGSNGQSTVCGLVPAAIVPVFTEFVVRLNVAPAGPLGPAGPVSPLAPAGPARPTVPAGPTAPMAPAGPVSPVLPIGPAGPTGPRGPLGPRTACVVFFALSALACPLETTPVALAVPATAAISAITATTIP